jgi:hypothetical protein
MTVNISYIALRGDVTENYTKTKKNWKHKEVQWSKLKNVLSNSRIQFSPYSFRNGVKTAQNWSNIKQNMLVFDIDDTMSISQAQRVFSKYKYLIGTTKSHRVEKRGVVCDRYRLCIPAINIPTEEQVYFRMLSLIVPSNDEQTETKTGAFLGNDDSIIIYNDGDILDCHKASLFAEEQLEDERREKVVIDPDLITSRNNFTLQRIKDNLTFESVVDVLERCGYEVVGNKFRLREDERTRSATISYKTLTITDYGSGYYGDVIDVLINYEHMSFKEAMRFISQSIDI